MIRTTHSSRIVKMLIVLEICMVVLIGRLFLVQYLQRESYLKSLLKTETKSQIKRGKILDRQYSVFAINQDMVSVVADPKVMTVAPHVVASKLAPLLDASESELLSALRKKDKRYVRLDMNLDYSRLKDLRGITESIYGLNYEVSGKRRYPRGEMASHIVGYTDFENKGIEGIENQHNAYLAPHELESAIDSADAKGRSNSPLNFGPDAAEQGHNIVLTLDESIQYIAEKELIAGCRKWRAKSGSVIVMHSKSGEILAMANYPAYDPNRYSQSKELAKRNLAIWAQYEPGSVFKVVTASAAINEKVMSADSQVYCELGRYRLPNGHVIHDIKPNTWLTLTEVIQKSSNIGIVKIASRLDKERLEDYTRRFGFGEKTGIDLPFEQEGSMRGFRKWDGYSMATVPFGQGISVTALQMLNAMNAIATRGVLLKPYVTQQILDRNGNLVKRFHPTPIRRVISSETAETITDMLVRVTELGGGIRARVRGYRVAGKTGTAQKAEKGKGYVDGKVTTSFAGFLPAEDPLVSIIVVVDEPAGAELSSRVTAPIFREIADQVMRYLTHKDLFAQRTTDVEVYDTN